MTDYHKPVGWWCPVCGDCEGRVKALQCLTIGKGHRAIPIYQPLPTPEPTTWGKSGGDEAVVAILTFGIHVIGMGFNINDDGARFCTASGDKFYVHGAERDATTAIRHVAEE